MTERREFLGAMAALFGGVLLPEPVLEIIRVPSVGRLGCGPDPNWMKTAMTGYMNAALYRPDNKVLLTGFRPVADLETLGEFDRWVAEQGDLLLTKR